MGMHAFPFFLGGRTGTPSKGQPSKTQDKKCSKLVLQPAACKNPAWGGFLFSRNGMGRISIFKKWFCCRRLAHRGWISLPKKWHGVAFSFQEMAWGGFLPPRNGMGLIPPSEKWHGVDFFKRNGSTLRAMEHTVGVMDPLLLRVYASF